MDKVDLESTLRVRIIIRITKIKSTGFFTYILAFLVAGLIFVRNFPINFFSSDSYEIRTNDPAQSISGYYAFRDTKWHIPLFQTNRLNAPEGTSISLTDSIPLAAMMVKPFARFLPSDFHYFKIWYLLSYVLQALAAVFIARQLDLKEWWMAVIFVILALSYPAFVQRLPHFALTTQSLLLFSFGLYLLCTKDDSRILLKPIWIFVWLILIFISLLIHPYFTAMIVPIYWAALIRSPRLMSNWKYLVAALIAPMIVIGTVYTILLGFSFSDKYLKVGGYQLYSMNLLAPFAGGNIIRLPDIYPPLDIQYYQSANYLGLGALGIILGGVFIHRKRIFGTITRHWSLSVLLICFTIFSLSDEIYLGERMILKYPNSISRLLTIFGEIFHAADRFFWPVVYIVLFSCAYWILKRRTSMGLIFVIMMLVIQIVDSPKPKIDQFFQQQDQAAELFPAKIWDQLLSGKKELFIHPAFGCGSGPLEISSLQFLAAKNSTIINTVRTARVTVDCEKKFSTMLNHIKGNGYVFVFVDSVTADEIEALIGPKSNTWCRHFIRGTVCVPYPSKQDRTLFKDSYFSTFP